MPKGVPWPRATVDSALEMRARGASTWEISERLAVPHSTVANWSLGRTPARDRVDRCPDCRGRTHDRPESSAYAFLLGLYLGDGFLTVNGDAVYLNVAMDESYPGIIGECRRAIAEILPWRRSHERKQPGKECIVVRSYGREWHCLFPQHGPGRKHRRRIRLEQWQRAATDEHTGQFLRGLVFSDGWRGTNSVRVDGRGYAYRRYQFSNRSDDIRRLFTDACDRLDIAWRPWGPWNISVARSDAVARLDRFVGPKY